MTIVHIGGQRKEVTYQGLYGNKFDIAYVSWAMAGEYKVKIKDGKLSPKAVSVWSVCHEDLQRLRDASVEANAEATEARKRNK